MKKTLLATLLMTTLTTSLQAQDFRFDEFSYTPEQTTFRLFAPNDAKCYVKVGKRRVKMARTADCLWTATVKGDQKGKPYVFDAGHGDTPGVFAKAVGINGQTAYVVDLRDTDPEGWESDRRPTLKTPADLVIYELHHRDFSIARPEAQHPGKFLALTEPWAIRHLTDLGINAVHILPSYDFGSVDEAHLERPQYNWGYDPVNYNVPEGSYATDPAQPLVRIREFKQMVQALHRAGIRVILDVVYNHTYDIDHSNFQKTYPDYYYRVGSNGSGCGNETASEQPMMRRFMLESVRYWAEEYHIDGFRFDLMGVHDIETMNEIRQMLDTIDPSIFVYGEGWSAGPCALPARRLGTKANIPQMPRIAAFSDEIRDALRGPFDDDSKGGFLVGLPDCEESLKYGIAGAIRHPQVDMARVNYSRQPWAVEPTQMISYVSCHDDMCLVDRLRASMPHAPGADPHAPGADPHASGADSHSSELIALDLLAQTAVFTSQGVPFMLSGEELLRDKKGVHNSFNAPDSINHLEWANLQRYPQVYEYYKRLIALRRHHPAFRLGSADLVRRHLEFLDAPKGVVAFRLKEYAGRDDWRNIIVVLNASRQPQTIAVPHSRYTVVCRQGVIDEGGLQQYIGNTVTASPLSATIIHD